MKSSLLYSCKKISKNIQLGGKSSCRSICIHVKLETRITAFIFALRIWHGYDASYSFLTINEGEVSAALSSLQSNSL